MALQKELEDRKAAQRQRLANESLTSSSKFFAQIVGAPSAMSPALDAMPVAPPPEKLVADENLAMLEAARPQDLLAGLRAEVESVVRDGGTSGEFWGLQAIALEHNPTSLPGSPLYERFVAAARSALGPDAPLSTTAPPPAAPAAPGATQEDAAGNAPTAEAPEAKEFLAATSFGGAKAGYVFKRGASGLGYYQDAPPEVTWDGSQRVASGGLSRGISSATAPPPPPLQLKLGFHGTPLPNIRPILRDGLDPAKRGQHGQAYGPGEYFAQFAWTSTHFCREGNKLLVFALLAPSPEAAVAGLDQSVAAHRLDALRTHRIIVVERAERQLPLATVTFSKPSPAVQHAAALAAKANAMASAAEAAARQAASKAKVMQLLMREEYDTAATLYEQQRRRRLRPRRRSRHSRRSVRSRHSRRTSRRSRHSRRSCRPSRRFVSSRHSRHSRCCSSHSRHSRHRPLAPRRPLALQRGRRGRASCASTCALCPRR